ncbi:MAG: RluA family pseudouridine synthase [Chloroflexi bacterium]|nr:MAG: RluA family pseudouridine synthase [Chloroflexota bacterium]
MAGQHIELKLNQPGERLDRALATARPDISRMQWQRLIKAGMVLVNGRSARPSLRLEGGEQIIATLPETTDTELKPQPIPLDIRYEDADILLINKPAGMVVHPAPGHEDSTLVNAILAYCPDLPGIGGERRPGIVHRLDKDTSGLILVAKHDQALAYLQAQFKERTVKKQYLALVEGHVQPPAALIDAPIGRDPRQRKKMSVITNPSLTARPAQTQYETVTTYDDFTLLACMPLTGRTHQIRVHLAYIGYPIVGDAIYGRRKQRIRLKRHFLHAARLTFRRPSDEQEMTFEAELPPELQQVLDELNRV